MPALSDEHLVSALRPFVAATGPVLRGLRDADPLRLGRLARRRAIASQQGEPAAVQPRPSSRVKRVLRGLGRGRDRVLDRLATSKLPGTPRWAVMSPEERDRWWVGRVGRFTSVVASIPGIGGALARRLPVSDILGLASQGLVLCAIAGEHGMTGRDQQVRMLASVIFGRELDPARFGDPYAAEVDREAGELAGDLARDGGHGSGDGERGRLAALARAIWRMGRSLFALHEELGRRPQGSRFWQLLANVPFLGAVANYRNERGGLRRAAKQAAAWVAREQGRTR